MEYYDDSSVQKDIDEDPKSSLRNYKKNMHKYGE